MTAAVTQFVATQMGQQYVEPPSFDLHGAYEDSSPGTPLIFILSQGAGMTRAEENW